MHDIKIKIKAFGDLTALELHHCYKLRNEVFVVGQGITCEPEVDADDPRCHHLLLFDAGRVVGTARLLPIDDGCAMKVGRLAVDAGYRGRGYGRSIMTAVHRYLDERRLRGILHAQQHLDRWYTSLGWRVVGEPFDEAGIPHLTMVRPVGG